MIGAWYGPIVASVSLRSASRSRLYALQWVLPTGSPATCWPVTDSFTHSVHMYKQMPLHLWEEEAKTSLGSTPLSHLGHKSIGVWILWRPDDCKAQDFPAGYVSGTLVVKRKLNAYLSIRAVVAGRFREQQGGYPCTWIRYARCIVHTGGLLLVAGGIHLPEG